MKAGIIPILNAIKLIKFKEINGTQKFIFSGTVHLYIFNGAEKT
jgi:hypothetical protein